MPIIQMSFRISDQQAAQIELLRGELSRDEFLRRALELGIHDFQDESTKAAKDFLYQGMLNVSESYKTARGNRRVLETKDHREEVTGRTTNGGNNV